MTRQASEDNTRLRREVLFTNDSRPKAGRERSELRRSATTRIASDDKSNIRSQDKHPKTTQGYGKAGRERSGLRRGATTRIASDGKSNIR